MPRNPKRGPIAIPIVMALIGVAGGYYVAQSQGKPKAETMPEPVIEQSSTKTKEQSGIKEPAKNPADTTQSTDAVKLVPNWEGNDIKFEKEPLKIASGENKYVAVVNAYLDEIPAVPKDARLKEAKLEGLELVLLFSDTFDKTYGTEDELTIVQGILKSLGQFKEVGRVRFTIMGRPLETLGNIDLTEPQAASAP